MKLEISSSDDLVELYGKYIELVENNTEGTLELTFAPGTYGVASIGPIQLDLGGNPAPKEPKIDILLRGRGTVVFRDMAILANARNVQLENLILTGRRQGLVQAKVAELFAMRNCVVVDNTWGGPWGGALIQVLGTYGQPAYRALIEDTWFMRNGEDSESTIVSIAPATESFVEEVQLVRVALVDNRNRSDISIRETRTISVTDSVAVKRNGGVALRYASVEQVLVERSTFIVDDAESIVGSDNASWSSGMDLRDSQLYVSSGSKLPAGVYGAAPQDAAQLRPRADLEDLVARVTDGRMPPVEARVALRDALGLRR